MKKLYVFFVLSILISFYCTKKIDQLEMKKGSPAYQLAEDLSSKIPYLDPDENKVLVETDKFEITIGELIQNMYSNSSKRAGQLRNLDVNRLKEVIKGSARSLGEKKLLLYKAEKASISVLDDEVDNVLSLQYSRAGGEQKFLDFLRNQGMTIEFVKKDMRDVLTVQHYLDKVLDSDIEVLEEEIQKVYKEDKTASVRHILLNTQGKSDSAKQEILRKMEGILKRAKKGEDFAELVKKYSEDPGSKDRGGLYENFGRGAMVKPFEEAAFSVPVGKISDIIETQFGYHILKVIDRKKETRPLEEIRQELETQITRTKKNEAYQNYVEKLKEEARFVMLEF